MVNIRGYEKLPHNDYQAVMNHLANVGPLAVNVYADDGWGNYSEGVYEGCDFDKDIKINHGVGLVGYGTDEKEGDYWIIRNHWATTWGENGYMRLRRTSETQCGYDKSAENGTTCKNQGIT